MIMEIQEQREFEVKECRSQRSGGKTVYVIDSLDALLKQLDQYVSISDYAVTHPQAAPAPVWGAFRCLFTVWFTKTLQLFYHFRG